MNVQISTSCSLPPN